MFWIWLGIIILLTLVEVMTINLTTIWFVLSGIVALIISLFSGDFLLQFGVFSVLGVILLITTRPILQRVLTKQKEKTNLDRVIGMTGLVTEEIDKFSHGEVKVDGKRWTAIADHKLTVDTVVTVLEIEGVKLRVEEGE